MIFMKMVARDREEIIHALEKHEEYVKKLGPLAETAKRMNNFIKRVKGSSEEKLKAANELFDFASQTDSATVEQTLEVISAGTNMDSSSFSMIH